MALKSVEDLVNDVSELVDVPEDKQSLLKMVVDKFLTDITSYTNRKREDLPEELNSSIVMRLVNWITDSGVFKSDAERQEAAPVSSITEGDTSVNFAVKQQDLAKVTSVDFLDQDFKRLLNHYRRVSWEAH